MASKTTSIPRFLLPQYGPLWRSTTRTLAFARPSSNASEVGQVLVRYASGTTAAGRFVTSSSRTAPSRASSHSAAARAAKHSAPTKKGAVSAAAATPKTPTSRPAVKPNTPGPQAPPAAEPVHKTETSKPIVLEKPEKFNPPSHGKRLPRSIPKHYGGGPSAEEIQTQKRKQYPGMPPPENTWSHWFINSRGVHLFITLGTLTSLALYTFAANFQAKSPYADLIPPISELPRHPFQYVGACVDVLRLHEEHESAATASNRRRRVDDVQKRNEYRRAHGLEPATGWWGASQVQPPPADSDSDSDSGTPETTEAGVVGTGAAAIQQPTPPAADLTPEGKRKKSFGIF